MCLKCLHGPLNAFSTSTKPRAWGKRAKNRAKTKIEQTKSKTPRDKSPLKT